MHVRFSNTYADYRPGVPLRNNRSWVLFLQWTHHLGFVNIHWHTRFTFTPYYTLIPSAKFWHLQTKGAARKNIAYLMNIDIDSCSDDSDFLNPPPKRNMGPKQEACNIPQQPPRPTEMLTDRDAAAKKTDKVPSLLLIIDNKRGCLCAIL
jgi:hypothetical protein